MLSVVSIECLKLTMHLESNYFSNWNLVGRRREINLKQYSRIINTYNY